MHVVRFFRLGASLAFAAALAVARPATAEPNDPYQTFRYEQEASPEIFRAVLEGVGVLSVGYIEYLTSTHQIKPGARVTYDSGLFIDKVSGNAQSFDANQFNTNFIGHPLGGTLYYFAARSNRLSVTQSFAWAFTGSLLWEYLGEIGEKPSYNDMIATPWGGIANGETFTQLSAFFARGKRTIHGQALKILFGIPHTIHEAVDGLDRERAPSTDALGFPNDIWHEFRASAGAGSSYQEHINGHGGGSFDSRFQLALDVKSLPHLGQEGKASRLYDDGNVAGLHFRLGATEAGLSDVLYEARVSPLGYYSHNARPDASGRLRGRSSIVGLTVGYEYGVHDYDRDRRRPKDTIAKVTLLGLLAEHWAYLGAARIRARLELGADFAGVRAYALPAYLARHAADFAASGAPVGASLPFVLQREGYYFAAGPSIEPSLEIALAPVTLRGGLRWDQYQGVLGIDVDETRQTKDIPRDDRRVIATARAAVSPFGALELAFEAEARLRQGRVGDTSDQRTERTLLGTFGAKF
jgi:hypothetical protein